MVHFGACLGRAGSVCRRRKRMYKRQWQKHQHNGKSFGMSMGLSGAHVGGFHAIVETFGGRLRFFWGAEWEGFFHDVDCGGLQDPVAVPEGFPTLGIPVSPPRPVPSFTGAQLEPFHFLHALSPPAQGGSGLPRITCDSCGDSELPFILRRHQFPVKLA